MYDPKESEFLFWWLLYRDGDHLTLQNQILFFQQLDTAFDMGDPAASVPRRVTCNEQGQQVSEWLVPIHDVAAFLATSVDG